MKFFRLILILAILAAGANGVHGFDKFHGMHGQPKLNYDSLFAEARPISESVEGSNLIDSCINRYHGLEMLKTLKGFRITYEMMQFLDKDAMEVVKKFEAGRKYRIQRKGHGSFEDRMLNGDKAWFQNPDTTIFLDSGRYKAELFSYLTLSMPLGIKTERFDAIRYGTRSNDSLQYIYMAKNDTLMIVLGIDPADYLIKSSEGVIRQGADNFVFVNYFSDHKDFDGYLFPGALTNVSMGLEVARSTVIRIDINPGFKEKDFLPENKESKHSIY